MDEVEILNQETLGERLQRQQEQATADGRVVDLSGSGSTEAASAARSSSSARKRPRRGQRETFALGSKAFTCAFDDHKLWYRGEVTKLLEGGRATVRFPEDGGGTVDVDMTTKLLRKEPPAGAALFVPKPETQGTGDDEDEISLAELKRREEARGKKRAAPAAAAAAAAADEDEVEDEDEEDGDESGDDDDEDEEDDSDFVDDDDGEEEEEDEAEEEEEEDTAAASSSTSAAAASSKPPSKKRKGPAPPKPTIVIKMDAKDIPSAPGPRVGPDDEEDAESRAAPPSSSASAGGGGGLSGPRLAAMEDKIGKMLERGLHENANEHEAQRCLRMAQKLLKRYNLSEAAIMSKRGELQDVGAMKGGAVRVQFCKAELGKPKRVQRKSKCSCPFCNALDWQERPDACGCCSSCHLHTYEPAAQCRECGATVCKDCYTTTRYEWKQPTLKIARPRWADDLASAVCANFEVKIYINRSNYNPTEFVFYGLRINAQLAAYAFKCAFARTHIMTKEYKPPEGEWERKKERARLYWGADPGSKGGYTGRARLDYARGIVRGIHDSVDRAQRERKARREARLRRWKERAVKLEESIATGKPYVEEKSNARVGSSSSSSAAAAAAADGDEADSDSDYNSPYEEGGGEDSSDDEDLDIPLSELRKRMALRAKVKLEKKMAAVMVKIEKAEAKEKVEGQLIVHQESLYKSVLEKDCGVKKLYAGRKRAKLKGQFNSAAYQQGKTDAKEIDLNQRAIKE